MWLQDDVGYIYTGYVARLGESDDDPVDPLSRIKVP